MKLYKVLSLEEVQELHRIMNPELARIEKEKKQEQERKAYDYITYNLIDACDNYIEKNYIFENISERFGKSLEDFKNDIFNKWKDRERSYEDPFIEEYEYDYSEDEDEDIYW